MVFFSKLTLQCPNCFFNRWAIKSQRFNALGFWPDVYFPRVWYPIAVSHMLSKRPGVCSPNQGLSDLGFVGLKYGMPSKELPKKLFTLLDLCVSSLRRGHANLLCIVPILADDPRGVPTTIVGKALRTPWLEALHLYMGTENSVDNRAIIF